MRQAQWLIATSLIVATTSAAYAQAAPGSREPEFSVPRAMVGFAVNGPHQLLGGAGAWLPGFLGGWGVYLDFKTDADSPGDSDTLAGITAEEALETGDERRFTENSYTSVNAALARAYGPEVIFYLGGGLTRENTYSEFFDPTNTRGQLGLYWAEYADSGTLRANVMGGMFFRIARRVSIQFGGEAVPLGMTVGVHLAL